jgi:hypothetical protein
VPPGPAGGVEGRLRAVVEGRPPAGEDARQGPGARPDRVHALVLPLLPEEPPPRASPRLLFPSRACSSSSSRRSRVFLPKVRRRWVETAACSAGSSAASPRGWGLSMGLDPVHHAARRHRVHEEHAERFNNFDEKPRVEEGAQGPELEADARVHGRGRPTSSRSTSRRPGSGG